MNTDNYMFFIAIIGSLMFYVQAYEIQKTKSAKNVSVFAFSISLFTSINWLCYGISTHTLPLILSGCLCTIGSMLVLFLLFLYPTRKVGKPHQESGKTPPGKWENPTRECGNSLVLNLPLNSKIIALFTR